MKTPVQNHKSGFVSIIGAPNVGKSTLLNRILGQKISITSKKAQTTRNRIMGIAHRPVSQLVFLDTPGIHPPRGALNSRMVDIAFSTLTDVDVILFIIDIDHPDSRCESLILNRLRAMKQPVILAINKIDRVQKADVFSSARQWEERHNFHAIVPISAKQGTQVETLMESMEKALPEGPPYFPPDMATDMPERFIAAEMIREKIFRLTGQEIPYSTAVIIDTFKERPDEQMVVISATIYVERDSQKGIIIGKKGIKLKQIGHDARKEMERMVGCKVFLKLFVKLKKNWTRDDRVLTGFGY